MATGGNPDPARILIQTDELDLVPTDANAQLEPLVAHRVRIAARIVKGHERTNEHDGFSQQKFDCSPWRRHALDALLRQKGPDQGRRLVYLFGSCPLAWCRSVVPEQDLLPGQLTKAGMPTMGSSLIGPMVSSVM
jgi:hypothetical protein